MGQVSPVDPGFTRERFMIRERHYSDAVVAELLKEFRRTGESRTRDEVVEHMRPLVQSIARKFAGREPQEDLESEGYVGLIRAVDRYTPERGTRFSTFATHLIAGQMRHYLRDRGHLIRQPAWLQELNTRVQRTAAELEQRLQRTPSIAEIAQATNLTEEGIEELMAAKQAAQTVRMQSGGDEGDDDYLEVDPEKFRSREYVTLELPIEDRIVLEAALEKLKDLERKVLHGFFFQDRNQSEIARELGISCNYAGYVLRNGLKHMRERLPHERSLNLERREGSSVLDLATGVYNREYFEQRLNEEVLRAKRYGHSVSVACLRLPADCPESALQAAAEALRKRTRKADVVGRTGERELAIIYPGTGEIAAQVTLRLADNLHSLVHGPIQAASATFPDAGASAPQLFAAAREAALPPRPPAPLTTPVPVGS